MIRWILAWGPAALWAAVLFYVSSQPTLPVNLHSGMDRVAHFGAYLVLGCFFAFAVRRLQITPLIALGLGWGYGLFDELHQSTVPGRHASVGDWVADAAGIAVGLLIHYYIFRASPEPVGATDLGNAESTRQ